MEKVMPRKVPTTAHIEFPIDKQKPMIGLTKENFFTPMQQICPNAVAKFCDWIDNYKERIGWNMLFESRPMHTKFHDIPFELQIGVLLKFFYEQLPDSLSVYGSNIIKPVSLFNSLRELFTRLEMHLQEKV